MHVMSPDNHEPDPNGDPITTTVDRNLLWAQLKFFADWSMTHTSLIEYNQSCRRLHGWFYPNILNGDVMMTKNICTIGVVTILLVLVGCATVSKEDCLLTDWYEIGRLDGMQGKPRTGFMNRAKACLEHGVSADREAYYRGHDDGLTYFCTEQKGFELGRNGSTYPSVCPLPAEEEFKAGYRDGIQLFCSAENGFEMGRLGQAYRHVCPPEFEPDFRAGYVKGKELHEYEAKIMSLKKRLDNIERKMAKKEKQLYSDNLSDAERSTLRSELRELDLEYRKVSRQLNYMEKTRPVAKNY